MPRWEKVLAGALPGGIDGLPTLRSTLAAMPKGEARALVDDLLSDWCRGRFAAPDWAVLTGGAGTSRAEHAIHRVWDALVEDELAPATIDETVFLGPGGAERWAWSPRWTLGQDEDLCLFGCAAALMRAAADPECPKRDYAISIADHDVRDQAHAWVIGPRGQTDPFVLAGELVPLARAAGATGVATYFERLASYRLRTKVDRDGAIARARDLFRCSVPRDDQFSVGVVGDEWLVSFLPSGFFVHRKTGVMRRASDATKR